MVFGEKYFVDKFVLGKEQRHRSEDQARMRTVRGMGMPPRHLEMMAPGDMPRRSLPATAYPLHRGMTYPPQQPMIQCVCRSLLSPIRQRHGPDCPLNPRYPFGREWMRQQLGLRERRRLHDRDWVHDDDDPEDIYDDDSDYEDGYTDDEIDYEDDLSMDPSMFSDDRYSYERHRPHPARHGHHRRPQRHPQATTGLEDIRIRYPGLLGRGHGRRMRRGDMGRDGMGGHHGYDDTSAASTFLTW